MNNGNGLARTQDIVFREDLYPRLETSAVTVQKYAEDLSVLPPVEINQHTELIDGWHRWTAHKKNGAEEIPVTITQTDSDTHLLELAIERNAKHGLQLSQADKRDMARRIYHVTPENERDSKKKQLAKILSVSERAVRDWLSRIDKDSKEARNQRIFDLWLACHTQQEIADTLGIPKGTVDALCLEMAKSPNLSKAELAAADHASDFEPPIYNIWKQQEKSAGSSHFGNSESRWVDNLLYLYTEPFDVVIDPFAGGGSTIDVCRKRFRRYFVSDRKPIVERESQIRKHDLTDGLLKPTQWKDVKLVYLDPPYWKQAAGKYSEDETDLANMELVDFNQALAKIIKGYAVKISDAFIAMIMSPTQWAAPDRGYTDHVLDMACAVDLPVEMRISAPYESQQYNGNQVQIAKDERMILALNREIIVWRVS